MDDPYERQDKKFRRFQRKNPGINFAQYSMARVVEAIHKGHAYKPSSALAIAHTHPEEFWSAAESKAQKWFKAMALRPRDKVIEYGCGSLRLGAHFIRYLDRGNFLGLDVVDGFFELGARAMGLDLFEAKASQLRVIDEAAIEAGEKFSADIVFSNLVCVHVHPDEIGDYFRNLSRLAGKRGARLFFNATVSDGVHRFEYNSWTQPLEFIKHSLPGLELVRLDTFAAKSKDGIEMTPMEFEFRR